MRHLSPSQNGQVLLITLLVLMVALTIALSLLGRTRTNITISNNVEESAQAFSAAEAGIEEALRTGVSTSGNLTLSGSASSYSTTVSSVGAQAGAYGFPQVTKRGETETLWLANHTSADKIDDTTRVYPNDTIDVCWKGVGGGGVPALAMMVLFKRGASYYIARTAYDPNNSRVGSNNFTLVGGAGAGCGQSAVYRQTISFSALSPSPPIDARNRDILLAMRFRPLYADASLFVDSGGIQLPTQGTMAVSSGTTITGLTRKIVVSQQFRSPGSIFDAAVVSQVGAFTH